MYRKLLLVAASHTGNNIFCTPAIRLLKRHLPESLLHVVALNRLSAEVFEGNPDISQLTVTDNKNTLRKLSRDYDEVICMNYKSRDYLENIPGLLCIPPLQHGMHHAEQILQFVADIIGVKVEDADRQYVIARYGSANLHVDFRNRYQVTPAQRLVSIHLGCGRTSIHGWKFFYKNRASHQKLWPVDAYTELAKALVGANPDIRIVVTGTKHETFLGQQLEKQVPGTINLIGKTSVSSLYSLMKTFDLFISQDCGVMHIAAAASVPMIGLFGPTAPEQTGPYPLSACHTLIKRASMAEIQVKEVQKAALQVLSGHQYQSAQVWRTDLSFDAQLECVLA